MRLYTFQSLEVLGKIATDKSYFPSWEKCAWNDETGFMEAYAWMMEQYNIRKKQEFSCPPVFWYTNIKDVRRLLGERQDARILITAEVPDKYILLHDFHAWHNVLNNSGMGMTCDDAFWINKDFYTDTTFDKVYSVYKRHIPSKEESWKEIFNLPKRDKWKQDVHAITPFIYDIWIEPKQQNIKTDEFAMT